MLQKIYDFISQTKYEDLPLESIDTCKLAFIDTLSVSLAAINSAEIDVLIQEIKESKDLNYFSVINELNKDQFSIILGTLSHTIDYDDVNFKFHGHPSVAIIPAILSYSKFERVLDGKEIILSYIIAFEVQALLGEHLGDTQYKNGYHTTSTLGIFGAAVVFTKLMKLSFVEFQNLIGMCTSFSSGTRKNFGTMTKPFHIGMLTKNSFYFSRLVRLGFTANKESFTFPMSFPEIYSNTELSQKSFSSLGVKWESQDFGVIIKKYPCCAYTHRSIDGVLDIVYETGISVSDIEEVNIKVNPKVISVLIYDEPQNGAEAKFSMQYCLVKSIVDKKLNLDSFLNSEVKNFQYKSVMNKVSMLVDQEQLGSNQELYSIIEIKTRNAVYTKKIVYPLGHPYNPLSEEMLREKVKDCLNQTNQLHKFDYLVSIQEKLESIDSNFLLELLIKE